MSTNNVPSKSDQRKDGNQNRQPQQNVSNSDDSQTIKGKPIVELRVTGEVKWFNVKHGYGFITRKDKQKDIFVHQTAIVRNNPDKYLRSLADKELVEFDIVQGEKGEEAVNVTGPAGQPVIGSKYAADRRPQRPRDNYRRNYDGEYVSNSRSFIRGRGRGRGMMRGPYGPPRGPFPPNYVPHFEDMGHAPMMPHPPFVGPQPQLPPPNHEFDGPFIRGRMPYQGPVRYGRGYNPRGGRFWHGNMGPPPMQSGPTNMPGQGYPYRGRSDGRGRGNNFRRGTNSDRLPQDHYHGEDNYEQNNRPYPGQRSN